MIGLKLFQNFRTYYEILAGYRFVAFLAILFEVIAGAFESLSLVSLIPVLSKFMNSSKNTGLNQKLNYLMHEYSPFADVVDSGLFYFIFLGICGVLSRALVQRYLYTAAAQVEKRLNTNLTNALLDMQWSRLVQQTHGNINKVILNDSAIVSQGVESFLGAVGRGAAVFGYFVMSIVVGGKLALLLLGFGLISGVAYYFCIGAIKRQGEKVSDLAGESAENVNDVFSALKYIIVNGSKKFARLKLEDSFSTKAIAKFRLAGPVAKTQIVGQLLGIVGIGSILWISVIYMDGINPELAIFSSLIIRMVPQMQAASHTYASSIRQLGSYDTYRKTFDDVSTHKAGSKENVNRPDELAILKGKTSFKSKISLKNVSYDHGNGQGLHGIDLSIKKGEWIGLCGPSGGGKTTLLDLICGLFVAQDGEILIDSQSLYSQDLESWRELISVVIQNPPIFSGTIAKNIAWSESNPDLARMKDAAIAAHAYDFIQEIGGFESKAGISGAKLSGGQKQRIALTQALYGQAEILVLDEATSGLDANTAAAVKSSFRKIKEMGVTGIIVSHDADMFELVDHLYVIENGRVTEKGSFDALARDKHSRFNSFYKTLQKAV